MDELELARHRFPDGDEVTGRVSLNPRPGAVGLFIDLPYGTAGFADVLYLPFEAADWPPVGTVTTFEVLQRRLGQVRLFPLDRYGDAWAWFGWSEEPPAVGEIATYRVVRHLDTTRRTLLEPARETGGSAAPPS